MKSWCVVRDLRAGAFGMARVVKRGNEKNEEIAVRKITHTDELQILCLLQDAPHIARVVDYTTCDGSHSLVKIFVQFCDGQDLARMLNGSSRLPLKVSRVIFQQLLKALNYCHNVTPAPIMHRDVRPSNILLRLNGAVKLNDFASACFMSSSPPPLPSQKLSKYSSPELHKQEYHDCSTDMWSLGCVLYEMLTGKQSFFRHGTKAASDSKDSSKSLQMSMEVFGSIGDTVVQLLANDPSRRPTANNIDLNTHAQHMVSTKLNVENVPNSTVETTLGKKDGETNVTRTSQDHDYNREAFRALANLSMDDEKSGRESTISKSRGSSDMGKPDRGNSISTNKDRFYLSTENMSSRRESLLRNGDEFATHAETHGIRALPAAENKLFLHRVEKLCPNYGELGVRDDEHPRSDQRGDGDGFFAGEDAFRCVAKLPANYAECTNVQKPMTATDKFENCVDELATDACRAALSNASEERVSSHATAISEDHGEIPANIPIVHNAYDECAPRRSTEALAEHHDVHLNEELHQLGAIIDERRDSQNTFSCVSESSHYSTALSDEFTHCRTLQPKTPEKEPVCHVDTDVQVFGSPPSRRIPVGDTPSVAHQACSNDHAIKVASPACSARSISRSFRHLETISPLPNAPVLSPASSTGEVKTLLLTHDDVLSAPASPAALEIKSFLNNLCFLPAESVDDATLLMRTHSESDAFSPQLSSATVRPETGFGCSIFSPEPSSNPVDNILFTPSLRCDARSPAVAPTSSETPKDDGLCYSSADNILIRPSSRRDARLPEVTLTSEARMDDTLCYSSSSSDCLSSLTSLAPEAFGIGSSHQMRPRSEDPALDLASQNQQTGRSRKIDVARSSWLAAADHKDQNENVNMSKLRVLSTAPSPPSATKGRNSAESSTRITSQARSGLDEISALLASELIVANDDTKTNSAHRAVAIPRLIIEKVGQVDQVDEIKEIEETQQLTKVEETKQLTMVDEEIKEIDEVAVVKEVEVIDEVDIVDEIEDIKEPEKIKTAKTFEEAAEIEETKEGNRLGAPCVSSIHDSKKSLPIAVFEALQAVERDLAAHPLAFTVNNTIKDLRNKLLDAADALVQHCHQRLKYTAPPPVPFHSKERSSTAKVTASAFRKKDKAPSSLKPRRARVHPSSSKRSKRRGKENCKGNKNTGDDIKDLLGAPKMMYKKKQCRKAVVDKRVQALQRMCDKIVRVASKLSNGDDVEDLNSVTSSSSCQLRLSTSSYCDENASSSDESDLFQRPIRNIHDIDVINDRPPIESTTSSNFERNDSPSAAPCDASSSSCHLAPVQRRKRRVVSHSAHNKIHERAVAVYGKKQERPHKQNDQRAKSDKHREELASARGPRRKFLLEERPLSGWVAPQEQPALDVVSNRRVNERRVSSAAARKGGGSSDGPPLGAGSHLDNCPVRVKKNGKGLKKPVPSSSSHRIIPKVTSPRRVSASGSRRGRIAHQSSSKAPLIHENGGVAWDISSPHGRVRLKCVRS